MIDLGEHHDAQISRQCASQANRLEDLHGSMEMLMLQGDNEAVSAYALEISRCAQKIAFAAAHLSTSGSE